ncbi:MAG TPA: CPBP family intramembrane glutamic endopeptidase [Thermoanaerobaculia bacterium]|nr:CPBP family intramembrane glutamic endopeptidase [Thermoanaerobaculia bacterium]
MLSPSALLFIAVIGIVIPVLAASGKRKLDTGIVVPRVPLYIETIILQSCLLLLSVWTARANGITLANSVDVRPRNLLFAGTLLVLALAGMLLADRYSSASTRLRLYAIIPINRDQRVLWIGVCAAAAISEEATYRGVLFAVTETMARSWWIAAVITALIFALAHLIQGWKSTVVVAIFGFAFQLLVLQSGGLYMAMIVHFLYDLITGFYLGPRAARMTADDNAIV